MNEHKRDITQDEKSIYAEHGNVYVNYGGGKKIQKHLTSPPFLPEIFLGRKTDLDAIYQKLFGDNNLLLLVNGRGGMGKTSIASKYYHAYQHKYAHTAWVLSEKSIANALLLLALPLGLQFGPQMGTDERLDALLTAMANLKKPCLLVLDNANELPDLEANYQRLRQCSNFHLLLTTRITNFKKAKTHPIEHLPKKEALDLFEQHYRPLLPDERDLFSEIREAVGGNTLVLELLAKNLEVLNELEDNYPLSALLTDLQEKGLLQLTQSEAVSTDYQSRGGKMREEKPEAIIAAMYDLGQLPQEEAALLSIFAVLPAESIPFATLETLLPDMPDKKKPLLSLAAKGWIEFNKMEKAFKCSPVVQEVTRSKNVELYSDCKALIDTLIEKLDYETSTGHFKNIGYGEAMIFTRYAVAAVNVFIEPDSDISLLCNRIGNYYITTGNLEKAFFFFEKDIEVSKNLCSSEPDNSNYKYSLAVSYNYLGNTHTSLGDLKKALEFYEKYHNISEDISQKNPENTQFKNGLAISYEKLGETQSSLGNLDEALKYFEDDAQLTKELYEAYPQNVSFKNGLAISYSKLGSTQSSLGNLDEALKYFEDETDWKKNSMKPTLKMCRSKTAWPSPTPNSAKRRAALATSTRP